MSAHNAKLPFILVKDGYTEKSENQHNKHQTSTQTIQTPTQTNSKIYTGKSKTLHRTFEQFYTEKFKHLHRKNQKSTQKKTNIYTE